MDDMLILTFIGHRPNKISKELYNWKSELSEKYIKFFMNYIAKYCSENSGKIVRCRSGMAFGIDTLFAIAVMRLYKNGYNVELDDYTNWRMQDRNVYMINGCNRVLVVWDGTKGGTGNCVNYAKKVGVDIDIVRPTEISGEVA